MFNRGSETFLPAGSAAGTHTDCAERKIKIIVSDEYIGQLQLIKMDQPLCRLTGQIHVRLRLGKDELMFVINRIRDDGFGLQLHAARVEPDNQPVYKHEARVMATVSIFAAGVAEGEDEESNKCHALRNKNVENETKTQKKMKR